MSLYEEMLVLLLTRMMLLQAASPSTVCQAESAAATRLARAPSTGPDSLADSRDGENSKFWMIWIPDSEKSGAGEERHELLRGSQI